MKNYIGLILYLILEIISIIIFKSIGLMSMLALWAAIFLFLTSRKLFTFESSASYHRSNKADETESDSLIQSNDQTTDHYELEEKKVYKEKWAYLLVTLVHIFLALLLYYISK